jgi:hypothetical protein
MKDEIFQFQGQSWVPQRRSKLTVSLDPTRRMPGELWINIETNFIPPWVREEEARTAKGYIEAEYRSLSLEISGFLPPLLEGWRSLAGMVMEHVPGVSQADGTVVEPGASGPAVELSSSGGGPAESGAWHDHLPPEPTESRLVFGEWHRHEDGGDEISYELEAFYASDRGLRERGRRLWNQIMEIAGGEPPHQIDEARLRDGWTLRHRGWVDFQMVHCLVPLNVADPVAYAQGLAGRELGRADWVRGRVKSISGYGHLVLLSVPP